MSVGKKYAAKDDVEALARKFARRIRGARVGSGPSGSAAGGASSFIELTDAPSSYAGAGFQVVRVDAAEAALEFADLGLGELVDVALGSGLQDGDVIAYDAASGLWIPVPQGAGNLSSLGDVQIGSGLADGDVLTWDAAAWKWVPAEPPGGVGGAPSDAKYIVGAADGDLSNERVKQSLHINYDLCDYPASPDAMDDEFDDASLDGKWTKENEAAAPNAVSESAFPGMLWWGLPETATDNWASAFKLYQTAPAGNQTLGFIARVSLAAFAAGGSMASFGGVGIYIGEPTGKDAVIAYVGYPTTAECLKAWGFSINNDVKAVLATLDRQMQFTAGQFAWIKLTKSTADPYTSANNYQSWFSLDGIVWHLTGAGSYTFSNAATQVGFFSRLPGNQTGDPVVHVLIDSFRRID